jgi:hypothetical protein
MFRYLSKAPLFLALPTLLALVGCDRESTDSASGEASTEQSATSPAEAEAEPPDDRAETDEDAQSDDAADNESTEGAPARQPGPRAEADANEQPDSAAPEPDVASARRDHTTQLWVGGRSEQNDKVRAAVDVRELGIFEFDGLEDLMGMRTAGPAPYESGALPDPFDDLERLDVLTSEGVVELAIEQVRPHSYGPRASDQTFWLRTEASEKLENGIGQNTLLGPAGTMDDDATYRTVDGEPPSEKIVSNLRDGVLENLEDDRRTSLERAFPPKGIEPEQKKRLEAGESLAEVIGESREFTSEHFTVVEGNFPEPHDLFVAVNGPEGNGGVHNQRFPIVRMSLFARENGTVTDLRFRRFGPNHELGHPAPAKIEPIATADPDGDGTEGIILRQDEDIDWLDFETD